MTRRLVGLVLCLAAALAVGQLAVGGKPPGEPQQPKAAVQPAGQPAPGHGQRAAEFIAAFNKGDAKAVAAFWVPDGNYVDQTGREYKGRAALEKLYQKVFAEGKGAKLTITVLSAKMVGADVALEEGITEVAPADGGPPTAARFSAVLVKRNNAWYFESVHDAVLHPPSNAEHFEDLEWLIGEWAGEEAKGESATSSYAWAENRNFIVSSFNTTVNGIPVVGGTQWIGWDAIDKHIRSWSFYSGGGFGEAVWTKEGNRWLMRTTARTADGKKITAVNVMTKVDADRATWQMTKLTVDGQPQPDPKPVNLKRVKARQP